MNFKLQLLLGQSVVLVEHANLEPQLFMPVLVGEHVVFRKLEFAYKTLSKKQTFKPQKTKKQQNAKKSNKTKSRIGSKASDKVQRRSGSSNRLRLKAGKPDKPKPASLAHKLVLLHPVYPKTPQQRSKLHLKPVCNFQGASLKPNTAKLELLQHDYKGHISNPFDILRKMFYVDACQKSLAGTRPKTLM